MFLCFTHWLTEICSLRFWLHCGERDLPALRVFHVPVSYSPSFLQAVASPKSCPACKFLSPPKEILNLCPFQMAVLPLPWVYMETQISTICVSCNNSFSTCRKVAISILSAVESGPERTSPMLSQGTVEVSIQTKTYRERTAVSKLMLLIRRYL